MTTPLLDGIRKEAMIVTDAIPLGMVVGFGELATHDMLKKKGLGTSREILNEAFLHDPVSVQQYLKKNAPGIRLINTEKRLDRFLKENYPDKDREAVRESLLDFIKNKNNAAAYIGPKKSYVISSGKLPKEIIQHELGHIEDYRSKGITFDDDKIYAGGGLRPLWAALWRPYYKKTKMKAEQEAWDRVPDSEKKKLLMRHAMNTYDKSFYETRGDIAATLGLAGLGFLALKHFGGMV